MLDFLKTGFGESGTDRPYLFCQHTWLKKKKMTDDAFDAEGNTFKADPEAERNVKIQDVEKYRCIYTFANVACKPGSRMCKRSPAL